MAATHGIPVHAVCIMEDEENSLDLCEEDVVEVISLSEGEEQPIEGKKT